MMEKRNIVEKNRTPESEYREDDRSSAFVSKSASLFEKRTEDEDTEDNERES